MPRPREIASLYLADASHDPGGRGHRTPSGHVNERYRRSHRHHRGATVAHSETRPANEYAALMQCAPHQEPEVALDILAPLRDTIMDAVDETLDARERFIFDALFSQRLSLRQLSRQMGLSKTHLARMRDEITAKLREALAGEPTIRGHLRDD